MKDYKSYFDGKRIVVTGASGFIGSHLCKELVSLKAFVVALIRPSSDLWRLNSVQGSIEIVKVDLLDGEMVSSVIESKNPDYIFHFAIPSHELLQTNLDLEKQIAISNQHLTNLFKAVHQKNLAFKAFIHACSGSIYKWNEGSESVNEETALAPNTLRGKLKLAQRNKCLELSEVYGIPARLARIFRAYGPMEVDFKLITKALNAYRFKEAIKIGDNSYKRDYAYVEDIVCGMLLLAMEKQNAPIEVNFGGQKSYSAEDVIVRLETLLGAEIPKELNAYPKNKFDQGVVMADCKLAKKMLGWEPMTSLDEGLSKTIDWYKSLSN